MSYASGAFWRFSIQLLFLLNVLANVLEEEASVDVDLHEAIDDKDSEVRGTCGWRGRLQINLTLGQGLLAVIF